jgi:hypothetical protein
MFKSLSVKGGASELGGFNTETNFKTYDTKSEKLSFNSNTLTNTFR